ncbi:MAG: flagellar basal body P-ring formation chaperone FlgA [Pseudomonadota bacterium]
MRSAIAVLPLVFGLSATNVVAESLVAARAIIGGSVIEEVDLRRSKKQYPGAISDPLDAIGQEARVTIHAGRPVHVNNVQAPALVERNDRVQISFTTKTLSITTEGRALDRGSVGDRVRVMNLSSRSTVSGVVTKDGRVEVSRP